MEADFFKLMELHIQDDMRRFEDLSERFKAIEGNFEKVETKIDRLCTKLDEFQEFKTTLIATSGEKSRVTSFIVSSVVSFVTIILAALIEHFIGKK